MENRTVTDPDQRRPEWRQAFATSAGIMGLVDDLGKPADHEEFRKAIIDGRMPVEEAIRTFITKPGPQPPIAPATQRVLDRLDTFQTAIESMLDAQSKQLEQFERSTQAQFRQFAGGQLRPLLRSFLENLPAIALSALISCGAAVAVVLLLRSS
jgi:hypothetical protein